MKNINPEIIAGERAAMKVKEFLYPDTAWTPKIAFSVGRKLAQLKKIMSNFYKNMTEIERLHELGNFSPEDIQEVFDTNNQGKDAKVCETDPLRSMCKL